MKTKIFAGVAAVCVAVLLVVIGAVFFGDTNTNPETEAGGDVSVSSTTVGSDVDVSDDGGAEPTPSTRVTGQDFVDALRMIEPTMAEGSPYRIESPDDSIYYPVLDDVPAEFDTHRSKGFPRNEQGAALAAIHLFERSETGIDLDSVLATIDEQTTGPGQQALRDRRIDFFDQNPEREDPLSGGGVGYDIGFYNPLNAEIKYYSVSSVDWAPDETSEQATEHLVLNLEVAWEDDQWKLVVPTDEFYGATFSPNDPTNRFGVVYS